MIHLSSHNWNDEKYVDNTYWDIIFQLEENDEDKSNDDILAEIKREVWIDPPRMDYSPTGQLFSSWIDVIDRNKYFVTIRHCITRDV